MTTTPPSTTTPTVEDPPPEDICFDCGSPVDKAQRSHSFVYGTGATAVELTVDVLTYVCPSCGLEFLGPEAEGPMHDAVCRHLGLLTPGEIRAIREMRGMSQAGFAAVTGLGTATLSRWEKGALIQNRANDRYLRVLRALPNAIGVLQRLGQNEDEQPSSDAAHDGGWTSIRERFRHLRDVAELTKQKTDFRLHPQAA